MSQYLSLKGTVDLPSRIGDGHGVHVIHASITDECTRKTTHVLNADYVVCDLLTIQMWDEREWIYEVLEWRPHCHMDNVIDPYNVKALYTLCEEVCNGNIVDLEDFIEWIKPMGSWCPEVSPGSPEYDKLWNDIKQTAEEIYSKLGSDDADHVDEVRAEVF